MDMMSLLLLIVLGSILGRVISSSSGAAKRRKKILRFGSRFDVEIIGVAAPRTILAINGQAPEPNALGFHDVSAQRQDEKRGRARVKVSYIDPMTRVREVRHVRIDRRDYNSNRIVKIAVPGTMKLSSFKVMQYNKQLFDGYVNSLDSRNLTKEKKKELIHKAALAMQSDSVQDEEGYVVLNPPVRGEACSLDDKMIFRQVGDDMEYLTDWTRNLE